MQFLFADHIYESKLHCGKNFLSKNFKVRYNQYWGAIGGIPNIKTKTSFFNLILIFQKSYINLDYVSFRYQMKQRTNKKHFISERKVKKYYGKF